MKKKYYADGGETDPMLEANASSESQDISKSMGAGPKNEEMPKAEKPKNRIVSKKELEDSGLSLRDFLNKERGLTRRNDKVKKEESAGIEEAMKNYTPRYTPPGSAPKQTTQKISPKVFMPERPDNSFPGAKFKSGGSVSSASKRADGIATKGKTRGTMVMCGGGMAYGKKK
jgi:hypothetical protein